jgi:hypothetical protein
VPQYPQNLLPAGNDLWQLGQSTWGTTGADGLRSIEGEGGTGVALDCWGAPHLTHVADDAGFMPPQEAQRMYLTVPCSFDSGFIVSSLPRGIGL